jgi:hypothetical protein
MVSPLFLFYRPEGANDYSLAQITFAISNRRGSEIIGLFYRAYGATASLDVTSVPTTFGTEMSNIRYIWKNDLSSIQLDSLSFVLDQMSVVFVESRLWGDLSDRMTAIERVARIANQEEKRRHDAAERAAQAQKAADGSAQPGANDASAADATSTDTQAAGASSSGGASAKGAPGQASSGNAAAANPASTDASSRNAAPAKSSLAGALPPGSPLAGFLPPDSPPASARPGSPASGSLPASSLALPPGSPLAGFMPPPQ